MTRVPRHDLDAEAAVLSAVLLDATALDGNPPPSVFGALCSVVTEAAMYRALGAK